MLKREKDSNISNGSITLDIMLILTMPVLGNL